jgi:orotate phosphoribosyltransferase
MAIRSPEELATGLFNKQAIRYAEASDEFWTLKSGRESPVYVNLRGLTSLSTGLEFPLAPDEEADVRKLVVKSYSELLEPKEGRFDHILGIPHAMTALAAMVGYERDESVLSMRSIDKAQYGAHKSIEGDYSEGDKVVALDDVITDGASKITTLEQVTSEGLVVKDFVVLVDREEGGREVLESQGLELSSAISLGGITYILAEQRLISQAQLMWTEAYYEKLVAEGVIEDIPDSLLNGPS